MTDSKIATWTKLETVSIKTEVLLSSVKISVPNGVAYTNVVDENFSLGSHLIRDIYVPRDIRLNEISLVLLPADTRIFAGGQFILECEGKFVQEQYPPASEGDPRLSGDGLHVEQVDRDAVILARYGVGTWGHWLAELLPKAVLAEKKYPGRFIYLMPYQTLSHQSNDEPWIQIKNSLQAYGIGENRIFPLYPNRNYHFSRLMAVTPVWSDHMIHPEAAALMRAGVSTPEGTPCFRLCLKRRPGSGRQIENYEQLEPLLCEKGFSFIEPGKMSFLQQVNAFRHASLLFGILGSDFSGLIYSPKNVRLITVAPQNFGDRFFYALLLEREGRQTDLRGQIVNEDSNYPHRSSFKINVSKVKQAIAMFTDDRSDFS